MTIVACCETWKLFFEATKNREGVCLIGLILDRWDASKREVRSKMLALPTLFIKNDFIK